MIRELAGPTSSISVMSRITTTCSEGIQACPATLRSIWGRFVSSITAPEEGEEALVGSREVDGHSGSVSLTDHG